MVMYDHLSWSKLKDMIINSVSYPLDEISEPDRLVQLQLNLERGNHPICDKESEGKIEDFILNELNHGLLIPIPKDKVISIPEAEACPIHIVKQATIDEEGNEIIKYRPCHDLSFSLHGLSNQSINKRHKKNEMHSMQCAFTFQCIIHYIVALCLKHPNTLILLSKYDVDGAFKRIMLCFQLVLKTIITLGTLAHAFMRSTFGGASFCANFSLLAEPIVDTMNESLHSNHL